MESHVENPASRNSHADPIYRLQLKTRTRSDKNDTLEDQINSERSRTPTLRLELALVILPRMRFTCTSTNEVYCIRCSRCGLFYISEIKQRLRDCFVEHLLSVRNKQQYLPVKNHFSSPSHSLGNMPILGILQCHNDATRKLEEQHLIFRLG
eukprot:g45122.t1